MKTRISPAYSQKNGKPQSFNIIGDLEVTIQVTGNAFDIPLEQLFQMAARINKKRSFLFVSKVLGKHIPVRPHVSLLSGAALGLLYQQFKGRDLPVRIEELLEAFEAPETAGDIYGRMKKRKMAVNEKTLFIGFAETATALGHSMFDMFEGEASFLHTTRESIAYMNSCIDFEEEHSHATTHRCYALDPAIFQEAETIVLVDDEMTTGKTAVNIIHDLHARYGKKDYIVASLLDWRSDEDIQRFSELEDELGVEVHCLSLITGQIVVSGTPIESAGEAEGLLKSIQAPDINVLYANHRFAALASRNGEVSYVQHTGRFGLTSEESCLLDREVEEAAAFLREYHTGGKTLCMGTGEFMYIPMRIAAELGGNTWYQSSTRSPIHPSSNSSYAVRSAYRFASPEHADVMNFMYNIPHGSYDEMFLFMEREIASEQMAELQQVLISLGIPRVHIVYFSRKCLESPAPIGSYNKEDVTFLLKDLSDIALEQRTEDREAAMQSGGHYSESLPIEYQPSAAYIQLFHDALSGSASRIAEAIGIVSERIIQRRGFDVVLASLARGGTPIGVLIKRYIKQVYGRDIPHYSLSIIRGKGIDENALLYMNQNHPSQRVQFVDGWTGKGAITKVLIAACSQMKRKYGIDLSADLAVLADPGHCAALFGTRDDFLIPSACLNATVSGLISRTVLRSDLIGANDFHGAKYYKEWDKADLSHAFVDTVSAYFDQTVDISKAEALRMEASPALHEVNWQGVQDITRIQSEFAVSDINFIKPGVGETTRVLLRRVPWKILVDRLDNPNVEHILLLAKDRGVPVEEYPHMTYSCCGIIKALKGDAE
ncbi:pyrimidine operon attenuation protein/uracil phosphoribosyltransferase [Paenibacillus endophyticus]|uniref:Pyrimidine operon attenuation protein/uracil phosphoribosyltransferase n=2 Tax=Paenibacillus endophyticus TaxID=1294268 RepID=A0A7W5GBT2_9BACL|nr:pyrimidine operon attenuation protein/uracil phosphoribosyltransferase [Paenibacillus endophyticus]